MDRTSRITSFRRPTGLTTIRWAFVEKHGVLRGPSRTPFKARGLMDLLQRQLAQNASALLSRWCDPVMGGSPPGSAGVPPAQILPQLRPSPSPESTGSGALPLLRPGPCGSRRQGGRLQHRRETERQPKGQHAGGRPRSRGCRPDGEVGGIPRATSLESRPVPFG